MVNHHFFAFRNPIILIAAAVILISILVGATAYPLLLPAKTRQYSQKEFHHHLTATVRYAISQLREHDANPREKAVVIDQLSTQLNQYHQFNQQRYQRLMSAARQVELKALDRLNTSNIITDQEANFYVRFFSRSLFRSSQHGLWEYIRLLRHQIKWHRLRHQHFQHHLAVNPRLVNSPHDRRQLAKHHRQIILKILKVTSKAVNEYLHKAETPENVNEIALVRRAYLQQQRLFTQGQELDGDTITSLFIDAFQYEHSYVQECLAAGKLSQALANALNEQISTDELVYIQSLD